VPVRRSTSHALSSVGLSIPTYRLPSELTSVDSKIAAAIMAAPISVGIEFPELTGSGVLVR
jgi:hypothetical protein